MAANNLIKGLWYDYSKPRGYQATLTLDVDDSNLLLSGLTVLVTIAGTSLWTLTTMLLHHRLAKNSRSDLIDLQHRVLLRNAGSAVSSIASFVKVFVAWRGRRPQRLVLRTLTLIVPAIIVMAAVVAASLLVSRVANKSHAGTLARLQPDQCGYLVQKKLQDEWGFSFLIVNQSQAARSYVNEYYLGNKQSTTAEFIYPQVKLPYETRNDAPCPFPNTTRCRVKGAYSIISGIIDSGEMLGINAVQGDRVSIQTNMTCSPLYIGDLLIQGKSILQQPLLSVKMGPREGWSGGTYNYAMNMTQTYTLDSVWYRPQNLTPVNWQPIADFRRNDADVSVHLMGRPYVFYTKPVDDPWFAAHDTIRGKISLGAFVAPDEELTAMGCVYQYTVCMSGGAAPCSPPSGVESALATVTSKDNPLGLNVAQKYTATSLLGMFDQASPYLTLMRLGDTGLFARSRVNGILSPGLPDTQWQYEALGWFSTMLAHLQLLTIQFISKAGIDTATYKIQVDYPRLHAAETGEEQTRRVKQENCVSQLVRTTGQVQNFSFLGVMLIVVLSLMIILLDLTLESVLGWLRKNPTVGSVARRADKNLQLLRRTHREDCHGDDDDAGWKDGFMGVPVKDLGDVASGEEFARLGMRMEDSYPNRSGERLLSSAGGSRP